MFSETSVASRSSIVIFAITDCFESFDLVQRLFWALKSVYVSVNTLEIESDHMNLTYMTVKQKLFFDAQKLLFFVRLALLYSSCTIFSFIYYAYWNFPYANHSRFTGKRNFNAFDSGYSNNNRNILTAEIF